MTAFGHATTADGKTQETVLSVAIAGYRKMTQVFITVGTTEELEEPIIEVYDNKESAQVAREEIEHQNRHVEDLEVYVTSRRVRN